MLKVRVVHATVALFLSASVVAGPGSSETALAGSERSDAESSVEIQDGCLNCTFAPRIYTRGSGRPSSDVVGFEGNPAGAYTLETDDFGTRGGRILLELNGKPVIVPAGEHRQEVVLDWDNTLEVSVVGMPGSQFRLRIYQEVASVVVTPNSKKSRIPDTQQFEAMALDRNDVEIPNQTFTWTSSDTTIATVDAGGMAETVGARHLWERWEHWTIRSGEGPIQIVALADETDVEGAATWSVSYGYVYVTLRLPHRDEVGSIDGPGIREFRYDEARLDDMKDQCDSESGNEEWVFYPLHPDPPAERLFKQCYPAWEQVQQARGSVFKGSKAPVINVGLYGRYCGGGHPVFPQKRGFADGEVDDEGEPEEVNIYQPKDPIDALCMVHDVSGELMGLDNTLDAHLAACIVRWGAENDELYYEGNRVAEGSVLWDQFWNAWPDMAEAKNSWIQETSLICTGSVYDNFKEMFGLAPPVKPGPALIG
ncbi:MAG: Ig-like domain-containing protein [Actinomycetota bacterium]